MSTPALFVAWSIDAFALFTASSIFAFAAAFLRLSRLVVDFRFLSFRRFINRCFCFVFLNNRWLYIVNRIYTVCFAVSTPLLLSPDLLTLSHYLRPHRLSLLLLPSLFCRIRCLIDFCFLSFGRFVYRCFASSFLTIVGWILLIESKPFDFAVSTPALFVAWSIAFLAVVTASSTFAFAATFSSSVALGV